MKELIAKVDLSKVAHKKMKKLSGGMKRRAGIAQAMLNNPKILKLKKFLAITMSAYVLCQSSEY